MRYMQIQSNQYNNFITIMIKMVGTSCNMRCDYCYEHIVKDTHKSIKFTNSKDVIEYLSEFLDYKHVFIVFHGGEPLLADYDEVRECLEYIQKNFQNEYRIQFQTNGTLLNDNWVNLFRQFEPNISLSISLDPIGDKDLRKSVLFNYRNVVNLNIQKYINEIRNIGIISVAHRYNYKYFDIFIEELISMGIRSLTINKYRSEKNDATYITELEYVNLLKQISLKWIQKGWYRQINIQPLNSLFSKNENKICIYLPDENKCSYFKTFYGRQDVNNYCDHVTNDKMPKIMKKCKLCDLYNFCGGGCLVETKDETFCDARRELFEFVKGVKNENI